MVNIMQVSYAQNKERQEDHLSIKKTVDSFMKLRSKGIHRTKDIRREMSPLVSYKVSDGDEPAISYDDREVYNRYQINNIEINGNEARVRLKLHMVGMIRNFREFYFSDKDIEKSLFFKKTAGKWIITNGLNPEYWKAVIMKVEEQNENEVYKMNHRAFSEGRSQYHKRLDSGYDWLVYNESKMIARAVKGIPPKRYTIVHNVIARMYKGNNYNFSNEDEKLIQYVKEHATLYELRLLRNAIFASKGYKFTNPNITIYFKDNFSDYKPTTKKITMSKIDIVNRDKILVLEKYRREREIAN